MYCRSCGKKVEEYCHNYLCLDCCAKRVQMEREALDELHPSNNQEPINEADLDNGEK